MALATVACGEDRPDFSSNETDDAPTDQKGESDAGETDDAVDPATDETSTDEADASGPTDDPVTDETPSDGAGTDDESTDDESTDDESTDDESTDDESTDDTATDETSTDDESTDDMATDEASTDDESTDDASNPECALDGECSAGICLDGACVPCDPGTHHGCETSATGSLCRNATQPEQRECVECLVEAETRTGATSCGSNGEVLQQACADGSWQDTTECLPTQTCSPSAPAQPGTTPCGLNGRGTLDRTCVEGAWTDSTSCDDPDVCEDGDTREGNTTCGVGDAGVLEQDCTLGAWVNNTTCIECDPAADDFRCYGGNSQRCGDDGVWVLDETCVAPTPACVEGTGLCGLCTASEVTCIDERTLGTCNASGAFVSTTCPFACVGDTACGGVCIPGDKQCQSTQTPSVCGSEGQWLPQANCPSGQACDSGTGECIGVPQIVSFTTSSATVNPGGSATLSWNVTGADQLQIDAGLGTVTGTSVQVLPNKHTVYTLTATNEAGSSTATVSVTVVSAGQVMSRRHYGTTLGEISYDVLIDEANGRVVTLDVYDTTSTPPTFHPTNLRVGIHSLTTGALETVTPAITGFSYYNSMVQTPSGYLLAAQNPATSESAVVLLNGSFELVDDYHFTVDTPFYEFSSDAARSSTGDIFVVGVSAAADAGFVSRINSALSSNTVQLVGKRASAVAIDSSDRVFVGADDGILNRYTAANITTPAKTATLGADDDVDDIAIDPSGSIVAVGSNAAGGFIAKFGADLGTRTWRVDLTGANAMAVAHVALDALGNVFVAGSVDTASQEEDVVVRAYSATGTLLWGPILAASSAADFVGGIAVASTGSVFVSGGARAQMNNFSGYSAATDCFLMVIQ